MLRKNHFDLRRLYTRRRRCVVFVCILFFFVSELRMQPRHDHGICSAVSRGVSSGAAAHLFVQALQLHLQALQEALPLDQLALRCSQGLVALLHLALQRVQLGDGIQAVQQL